MARVFWVSMSTKEPRPYYLENRKWYPALLREPGGRSVLVWVVDTAYGGTGAAPVWACLQNRCLCCSAKPEKCGARQ